MPETETWATEPPDPTGDAAELVRRVEGGDRSAEAELVRRHGRGVSLLLGRHTRTAAEAEDLYQDTFRLAIEKLRAGELRDPSRLPAFLARMARNLAIEHYRKAGRRKTDTASDTVERAGESGSAPAFPMAAPSFPGPLGEILEREEAALVRRVIGELSTERDREVLYRFYIAEDDREEIARDLDLSGLQLNRVLHRARERYRKLYEERAGGAAGPAGVAARMVLFLFASAILQHFVSLTAWRHPS